MLDAVGVDAGAELLRDDVDEVVLEILRDARNERDADRGAQQERDAAEELTGAVPASNLVAYSSMTCRKINGSSSEKTWLMAASSSARATRPR